MGGEVEVGTPTTSEGAVFLVSGADFFPFSEKRNIRTQNNCLLEGFILSSYQVQRGLSTGLAHLLDGIDH